MRFKVLLTAFTFIVFNSWSQVVINEYTAANYNNYQDNYNEYEDWVEFYNPTTGNIDLNGYFLSDKDNNLTNLRQIGAIVAADIINPEKNRIGYQVAQFGIKYGALLRPIGDCIYWLPPLNTDFNTNASIG